jgi:hypothetical protein
MMLLALVCAAMLLLTVAQASVSGFSGGLTLDELSQSGISSLTQAQASVLDGLVRHDVELARQGGVTGFSSDFVARHSAQERSAAGIDALSPREGLHL